MDANKMALSASCKYEWWTIRQTTFECFQNAAIWIRFAISKYLIIHNRER